MEKTLDSRLTGIHDRVPPRRLLEDLRHGSGKSRMPSIRYHDQTFLKTKVLYGLSDSKCKDVTHCLLSRVLPASSHGKRGVDPRAAG
jgi:hypothetical protein